MNEIKIELVEVNPREFFGDQNTNVELLRTYFPKLKIVARGNTIKAFGEEVILDEFEKRIEMLVAHFTKFNKLDQDTLERILTADSSKAIEAMDDKESFIVHGVGGRTIKAKTINQQRLPWRLGSNRCMSIVRLCKKRPMIAAMIVSLCWNA